MKPSGVLLIVAGAWLLSQVLGGNLLGRLNITGATQNPNQQNLAPGNKAPGQPGQVPLPPGVY